MPEGNGDYPQHISEYCINKTYTSSPEFGLRGYAKLYFDGFNKDKKSDIVVWRKLYVSNQTKEEKKGFEKLSDTFGHYSFIDDEYKLEQTSPEDIQKWLSQNNLTWPQQKRM